MANLFERVTTFCSTEDDGKTYGDARLRWGKKTSYQMGGKDKGMRVDVEAICFNFVCEL